MTTIVYRNGVLAGDMLATDGDIKLPGSFKKVFKNKKGWIWGCCGTGGPICDFDRWMMEYCPETLPNRNIPKSGDYEAIVVDPKGNVYDVSKGWVELQPSDMRFFAIGSGAAAAYGALWHGATAVEAVLCATRVDRNSGQGIAYEELDKNKEQDEQRESTPTD
jgi:hypothetical protein